MAGPRVGLRLLEKPRQVEAALWRRLRQGREDGARAALFEHYIVLARRIAQREFRARPPYGLERTDFEQLAYSGLLEAIDRFDPLHGAPFEAYAKHRIRGAIADGVERSSESGAQYSYRRRAEADRLQSLRAEAKDGDYIGALAELSAALAIGILAENAKILLETPSPELDAYETLSWRELQLSVLREIEQLPDKQRTVMQQHYIHDVSFVQIAQLMGVSKGRISQIHRAAILALRARLRRPS